MNSIITSFHFAMLFVSENDEVSFVSSLKSFKADAKTSIELPSISG